MADLIEYAIKVDKSGASPALQSIADEADKAEEALSSTEKAARDLAAAMGATVDAQGRLRDSTGRFVPMSKQSEELQRALADAFGKASKGADGLGDALGAAGKSSQKAADSVGAMRAASGNLRNQLFDIYVQLQGGQSPFTVLSQQGPQVIDALDGVTDKTGAFAGALGVSASALAPLVIGLGALAAGYAVIRNETERANEAQNSAAASLDAVQNAALKAANAIDQTRGAYERFQQIQLSLEQQIAVLSGARTQAEVDLENQIRQATDAAEPRMLALGQQVAALEQQIALEKEVNGELLARAALGDREGQSAAKRLDALKKQRDAAQNSLDLLKIEAAEIVMLAEQASNLEQAEQRRTEYTKVASKELKAQTKELEKQAAELERIHAAQRAREAERLRSSFGAAQSGLAGLAGADTVALTQASAALGFTLQDLTDRLASANTADEFEQIAGYIAQLGAQVEETTGQLRQSGEEAAKAFNEASMAARRGPEGFTSAVSTVSGGGSGVISAIGGLGPQGAAVAASLDLLKQFGQGGNAFMDIDQTIKDITEGLKRIGPALAEALPLILVDSIPELLKALPDVLVSVGEDIIPAIAQSLGPLIETLIGEVIPITVLQIPNLVVALITVAIPELIKAIPDIVQALFGPETWKAARTEFVAGFKSLFSDLFSSGAASALGAGIQESLLKVFSVDFWRGVVSNLMEAIRSLLTGNLGAVPRGGPGSLRGLAERAGDRFGGVTNIFNGPMSDRRLLSAIARGNRRRLGVSGA